MPSGSPAGAFRTVAGEQIITMTMCRNLEPSSAVRRRCSICSAVNVGGRSRRFLPALARSCPSLMQRVGYR